MNNEESNVVEKQNKKSSAALLILILVIISGVVGMSVMLTQMDKKETTEKSKEVEKKEQYSTYRLNGNNLQAFDLYFLQLENEEVNKVYSPIAIKYALRMLEEGSNGNTKKQISDVIGTYSSKKYINSKNMSFANGLFIKDSFKEKIKDTYITTLKDKYEAEVIYDSFETPNVLNKWISDKTFNMIKNMVGDISDKDFILTNALAIDMEWINKIQSQNKMYSVRYDHRDFSEYVGPLDLDDYTSLDFNNKKINAKSAKIAAVANRYDIIKTLGEDKIRATVTNEYNKWLKEGAPDSCSGNIKNEPDAKTYVNKYMKELNTGYNDVSSSTDFMFYTDDDVKVFAKDLKEYNGTTLQYVGIMPTKDSLTDYVKNTKSDDINKLISNLKSIELNSFKDGVVTDITGYIPMFNFEYQLALKDDLNKLGITDVFDREKADLSNLTTERASIDKAEHKTNIEFSNDGIKASAAVTLGGAGAANCGFDYLFDVPVEKIDLTFNKPYLFFVRDKDTGEVWFTGTVYEPVVFKAATYE